MRAPRVHDFRKTAHNAIVALRPHRMSCFLFVWRGDAAKRHWWHPSYCALLALESAFEDPALGLLPSYFTKKKSKKRQKKDTLTRVEAMAVRLSPAQSPR